MAMTVCATMLHSMPVVGPGARRGHPSMPGAVARQPLVRVAAGTTGVCCRRSAAEMNQSSHLCGRYHHAAVMIYKVGTCAGRC